MWHNRAESSVQVKQGILKRRHRVSRLYSPRELLRPSPALWPRFYSLRPLELPSLASVTSPTMSSSFTPALSAYAAIRIDPTAMVAHLDAQAVEEARGIHPKTYLIWTAFVCPPAIVKYLLLIPHRRNRIRRSPAGNGSFSTCAPSALPFGPSTRSGASSRICVFPSSRTRRIPQAALQFALARCFRTTTATTGRG